MLTNIAITQICEGGNHADICFDFLADNRVLKGIEYSTFFAEDSSGDDIINYLKYLLNQHEHSDWLSLKNALEA